MPASVTRHSNSSSKSAKLVAGDEVNAGTRQGMQLPVLDDPAGREGLLPVAAQRGRGRAVEQGDPAILHGRDLRRHGDGCGRVDRADTRRQREHRREHRGACPPGASGLADSFTRPWSVKCPIPSVRRAAPGRYHRVVTEGPAELVRAPVSGPHQPLPDEVLDALVTVLDEVRLGRSRSRSELVARTGLGRAIVARRVQELIDRGLLSEGEVGPSTGGRPPRQLAFCADAGHVLVADLGATSIDVAVTSLDGRILGHHDEPARIEDGPERCLERVDALFDSLLRTTQDIPGRLWGVGIGVPGPVEFELGRPISPPIMPGWDGYPIRERFTQRYGAPVWVDNDVNLLALGEWRSGVAAGHENVVVVKIGTGIGAGIISDGRLHRGAQGSAGDVGPHPGPDDASIVCRCGNVGCLEALAGGAALGRAAEAAALDGRTSRLACRARPARDACPRRMWRGLPRHGDPVAVAHAAEAGSLVGSMLAERRQLLQPIADRHRRRRRQFSPTSSWPRSASRLPPLPAAGDPRSVDPALVARRLAGRHRRVVDGG